MLNRKAIIVMCGLALALWIGLLAFMNLRPSQSADQLLFLLLWALTIWVSMAALSYVLNGRLAASRGPQGDLNRALRQGLLVSILATVIMALRFLHMLTIFTAIILAFVAILLEALIAVRSR